MNKDFWKGFLAGLFIGAAIALAAAGMYAWIAIGAVPLVGKMIQYKIKQRAGVIPTKDFSKGRGDRRRDSNR